MNLTEAAIEWWGKAGQRSLARSALLEGAEQLKRALDQIATLTATPALRREQIKLEVAFANALALTGDLAGGKKHYEPGACDLRSCRTPFAYNAFWPGCWVCVATRLSHGFA
jgi:hypothetical protein